MLLSRVHWLATAGHLRVTEQRAVDLIQAGGVGTIHSLLATPVEHRDPQLGEAMLDAVLGRALTDGPIVAPAGAVALRTLAHDVDALSETERRLLIEWLDRITATPTVTYEA